jgi:hypothetical protein
MILKILSGLIKKLLKKRCPICGKRSQVRQTGKGKICFPCYLANTTRQERRAFERAAKKYEARKNKP